MQRLKLTRLFRGFSCASYDPFWPWFSTELCASNYDTGGFSFAALPTPSVKFQSETETLPATRLLGFTIYNYGIRIQSGSIPITSSSSTSTGLSITSTHPSPTPAASPSPTAQSKSLSPGAKVGIGVGIAILVLILGLLAGCFYFLRRRKVLKRGQGQPLGSDLPELSKSHVDNSTNEKFPFSPPRIELQETEVNMPGAHSGEPSELSATASVSRKPVSASYIPDSRLAMNEEPQVGNPTPYSMQQVTQRVEASNAGDNPPEAQSEIQQELAQIREEKERLKRLMELDKREKELRQKLRHSGT